MIYSRDKEVQPNLMSNIEWAPAQTIIRCNSYTEAVVYCQFLNIDGKNDWRLPTQTERISQDAYYCWDDSDGYGPSNQDTYFNWVVHAVRDL